MTRSQEVWFNGGMTETAYRVTYRKSVGRYYVDLDGQQAGWVLKAEGGWKFYAPTRSALAGALLAVEPLRGTAVEEGLSNLRIRHLGSIYRLDMDRSSDTYMEDVRVYFDCDQLLATVDRLSDVRYGLVS